MTTTEPIDTHTFEVTAAEGSVSSKHMICAAYYRILDGWVSFKNANHQIVADFPENRVRMIRRLDEPS